MTIFKHLKIFHEMDYLLKSPNAIEKADRYFKHPIEQTKDLQAENIKTFFIGWRKTLDHVVPNTAALQSNFNKANMLILRVHDIRK